ncbi:MAG: AAA family ATPase [Candidatus Bathyarchaeia archaeon]
MVKLLALKAINFKKLNLDSLKFPDGILLIVGENEAGKSTILEAILYALFRRVVKPFKVPKIDRIINFNANKALVELDFQVREKKYRVTREISRRKSSAKLYELKPTGETTPIASTPEAVDKEIKEILGNVTYDEFVSSNIVIQKDLERVLELSKGDRERIINVFLNIESFDKAKDKLNEKRRSIEGTMASKGDLEYEKEKLKQLEFELKNFKEMRKNIESIEAELKNLKKKFPEVEETREAFIEKYKLLKDYKEKLEKIESINNQIKILDAEIKSSLGIIKDKETILKEIDNERKELERLRNELSKEGMLINEPEEVFKQILNERKKGMMVLIFSILAIFLSIVIMSSLFGSLASVLLLLLLIPLSYWRKQSKKFGEGSRLSKLARDYSSQFERVNRSIPRKKGLIDDLTDLHKKVESKNLEIDRLREDSSKIVLPKLPENLTFSKDAYEEIERRKDEAIEEYEKTKTKLEMLENEHEKIRDYLAENEDIPKKFEEQKKRVRDLERELKIIKRAIEIIDDVETNLRGKVHPSIERYMERLLPLMTNGRYRSVQLDESYNLKVFDSDAGEFLEKDIYSGGTVDQFLLAMRIAFALSLLPEVKGIYPQFLFLDEPLSSSDEERREAIINLLDAELTKSFPQIIIISHLPELIERLPNYVRLRDGRIIESSIGC